MSESNFKNKPPREVGVNIKVLRDAVLNMLLLILSDFRVGRFQDGV